MAWRAYKVKKKIYLTLLVGLIIACLIPEVGFGQSEKKLKPETVWRQETCKPGIEMNDSILFFNSEEIRIEASIMKRFYVTHAGKLSTIDSVFTISRVIPAKTAGKLVDMKKSGKIIVDGVSYDKITVMSIAFFIGGEVYKPFFLRAEGGSCILKSKVNIVFRGKNYEVPTTSTNPCKLLIDSNAEIVTIKNKKVATGYTIGIVDE